MKFSCSEEDLKRLSVADINSMKKSRLQDCLTLLKLSKSGNVPDLKERLIHALESREGTSINASRAPAGLAGAGSSSRALSSAATGLAGTSAATGLAAASSSDATRNGAPAGISATGLAGSRTGMGDAVVNRKKKKWRVTDPAEIAPNYYHKDLFLANFPLVDVVEIEKGRAFPVRDKFGSVVLDPEATQEARNIWIQRIFEVDRGYKEPDNESQAFPGHFGIIESLSMFARPSKADLVTHNEKSRKRKWTPDAVEEELKSKKLAFGKPKDGWLEHSPYSLGDKEGGQPSGGLGSSSDKEGGQPSGGLDTYMDKDEENTGMYIVPDIIDASLGANNSGLDVVLEEVAELQGSVIEHEDVPTGFADGVLHVCDERKTRWKKLKSDRVACVLERKFLEDKYKYNARFQGGFYAVKHAILNLQNGHALPVYVLVMTKSMWTYGILVPEGYVHIRDGKIYEPSMELFRQHQEMTGISETSYVKLQEKLAQGTEFYGACFKDNPEAVYRNGPMLVGKLFLSEEWLSLPKPESYGDAAPGVHRLFNGLMRLVLGDSVCDMTEPDLYSRVHLRKRMEEERKQSFFPQRRENLWTFDHIREEVARESSQTL